MEKVYPSHFRAESDWELFALRFAELLVLRDYSGAYAMTAIHLRSVNSVHWLTERIEELHRDSDDALGPCHVESSGPLPQNSMIGAVYVSIGGSNNEGIFLGVARSQGQLEISQILGIGRP